jgi:hypothetical protein
MDRPNWCTVYFVYIRLFPTEAQAVLWQPDHKGLCGEARVYLAEEVLGDALAVGWLRADHSCAFVGEDMAVRSEESQLL